MRVLVVHDRYSSRVPSGENLAVDDEVRWLVEAGVDVARHEVSNDEIISPGPLARARAGIEAMWSLSARRRFLKVLDDHRPDLVHVHNLFPLLTGSVPAAARRRGLPVVWTVHNRRVRCVAGGNFRDGGSCHECRPGWRVPGTVHRCYAGSAAASALVTASSSLFRSTARSQGVTAIAISEDIARWLRSSGGFGGDRVRVKHNGVAGPDAPITRPADHAAFLFLGRLAEDKGVRLMLEAWRRADVDAELRIVGDGDLADDVRAATATDPRVTWIGQVSPDQTGPEVDASRAVIVPSIWHEPFGRTAAEALAYGRPVITTGRGGLSEIVDESTGWVTGVDPDAMAAALVEAAGSADAIQRRSDRAAARHARDAGWIAGTDAAAPARAIDEAASSDAVVAAKGAAGRARHAELFSPEATTAALIDIYREAMDDTGRSGHRAG
jgi:glycosyltransferase involved in cell wall biosynthesis